MPVKYIPYFPETVQGQALLHNFTRSKRVLRYTENNKVFDRIKRGMPCYDLLLKEKVKAATQHRKQLKSAGASTTIAEKNLVIHGECISACAYLKEQNIDVDLVYIDPPFASGADYAKKIYIRRNPKVAEAIAAAELEMEAGDAGTFEEKMYGDVWRKEDYLNWMYENLLAIKTVMSDTASIYVHLDWHIGHYVKILMDEIFGEENFRNEIIWAYHGPGSPGQKNFTRKHDTIFWYAKNEKNFLFNDLEVREAYHETTAAKFDSEGTGFAGGAGFNANRGKIPEDWWVMPVVSRMRNEIVGYATQKPEKLLQRIIKASSNEGMMVADFFGGSGVTAKVAHDLKRNFIHCDVGINSIQTARDRLKNAKADFDVFEVKDGVNLFRNPQQTMDKVAMLIPGLLQGFKGLGKFWFGAFVESASGTVPVYMPNLLNSQERMLDVARINIIINEAAPKLPSAIEKIVIYFIDIEDPPAAEKFIANNNSSGKKIVLKDLKEILDDVVMEDMVETTCTKNGKEYCVEIKSFMSDRLTQKIHAFNEKASLQNAAKQNKLLRLNISGQGLELIELIATDCEKAEGEWCSSHEIKIDKLGFTSIDDVKTKSFWDGKIISKKKPLRLKVRNICGDETIITIDNKAIADVNRK